MYLCSHGQKVERGTVRISNHQLQSRLRTERFVVISRKVDRLCLVALLCYNFVFIVDVVLDSW